MQRAHASQTPQVRKQPRWMGLGTVKAPDFAGPQYQFSNGHVTEQDPLLDGHIKTLQLTPDIGLHAVEGCDLRTFTSSTPAQQGLHIVIVLEGRVDVAFDHVLLQLPPLAPAVPAPAAPCASGALMHTCQPSMFVRNWRMGKFERKLSVHVHPHLLHTLAHSADYAHLQSLLPQHLCMQLWQPSARAVVLAEQIIHLLSQGSAALLLHSRTLELLHEALCQPLQTASNAATRPTLQLREHLRMAKLKTLLDTHQDGGAPVATLARNMGLSPSALQRHFRQIYGTSIDDYRRTQRLERAHALLEQTGCSVLEVAHASGYTSAANFSTAFKRHFGISPKWVRAKL